MEHEHDATMVRDRRRAGGSRGQRQADACEDEQTMGAVLAWKMDCSLRRCTCYTVRELPCLPLYRSAIYAAFSYDVGITLG